MIMTRKDLEEAYSLANACRPPPIQHQGSDDYLLQQQQECERGQIGWFSRHEIRGRLEDPAYDNQGIESLPMEETTSARGDPKSIEKRMIFRTTLLMCIAANSHHETLDIDKATLAVHADPAEQKLQIG